MTSRQTRDDDARGRPWFEELFASHQAQVWAFAARPTGAADADDVVAEVFTTAWRRRDDVLPWLYRTASHHVLHAQRARVRQLRTASAIGDLPPDGPADVADRVAAALDAHDEVSAALALLPEADPERSCACGPGSTSTSPPSPTCSESAPVPRGCAHPPDQC